MFLLGAHGLLANGIPVGAVDGSRSLFALLNPDFSLGQVSNRRVAAGGGGCRHLVLQFIRLRHRPSIRVIVIVLLIVLVILVVIPLSSRARPRISGSGFDCGTPPVPGTLPITSWVEKSLARRLAYYS